MSLRGGGKWKDLVKRLLRLGYIDQELATQMNADLINLTSQGVKGESGFEGKKEAVLNWLKFHLDYVTPEQRRRLRDTIDRITRANSYEINWNLNTIIPENSQSTINPLVATANALREGVSFSGLGKPRRRRCKKCGLFK